MATKLYDLVRVGTSTTGQGTITLGGAIPGFLTFVQAGVQDGDTVAYGISDGTASEVGHGTYGAGGSTLTRGVIVSTAGNLPIELSGQAQVMILGLAEDLVLVDSDALLRSLQVGTPGNSSVSTDPVLIVSDNAAAVAHAFGRQILVLGDEDTAAGATVVAYGAAPGIEGARANGSPASLSALVAGNLMYEWSSKGFDGTSWAEGAYIRVVCETGWATGSHGSQLRIGTAKNGSATAADRWVLFASGCIAGLNYGLNSSEVDYGPAWYVGAGLGLFHPTSGQVKLTAGTGSGTHNVVMPLVDGIIPTTASTNVQLNPVTGEITGADHGTTNVMLALQPARTMKGNDDPTNPLTCVDLTVPRVQKLLAQSSFIVVAEDVSFATVADTTISITLPQGFTGYSFDFITIANASGTLSGGSVGVFAGAGGTGATIVASTVCTITTSSANTNNNMQELTITQEATRSVTYASVNFRVLATVPGATADVVFTIRPLY